MLVHCCFLTKSLLFLQINFTNEDWGARCCGESLLVQRGRESTQLTFLPSLWSEAVPSGYLKKKQHTKNSYKLSVCPFYFQCVSLSTSCPPLLSMVVLNNPVFISCQLVACSTS